MKEKILSVTRMPNRLMRCGKIRGNIEPPTAVPEFRCQNKSQYAKEIMSHNKHTCEHYAICHSTTLDEPFGHEGHAWGK